MHLLADPAWLLVHAESGLWFVEASTLARRARLRTGAIAASDVTRDGKRLAYVECTLAPGAALRADLSNQPCDLVVLDVPSLAEVRREPVKAPHSVRFSHDGKTVASAAGHFGGATVVPLEGGGTPWQTHVVSTAVAAIPLRETRVAYVGDDHSIVVEERDVREPVFARIGGGPKVDLILFNVGAALDDATMLHDPAKDRLLFVGRPKATVLEGLSTATPHFGEPIELASMSDATAPFAYGFDRSRYVERFALKEPWKFSGRRDVLFAPSGDAFELSEHRVYRIGRDGMSRAADFGPTQDRTEGSLGPGDVLLYSYRSSRFQLARVALGAFQLDATPERVGEVASEHHHPPFVFSDGSRAFLVADAQNRAGIVRVPRTGPPAPVESLGLGCLHFASGYASGPDRFAFRTEDDVLVEIGPHDWRVVDREVTFGARVAWSASESCWSITGSQKPRCVR